MFLYILYFSKIFTCSDLSPKIEKISYPTKKAFNYFECSVKFESTKSSTRRREETRKKIRFRSIQTKCHIQVLEPRWARPSWMLQSTPAIIFSIIPSMVSWRLALYVYIHPFLYILIYYIVLYNVYNPHCVSLWSVL